MNKLSYFEGSKNNIAMIKKGHKNQGLDMAQAIVAYYLVIIITLPLVFVVDLVAIIPTFITNRGRNNGKK